MKTLKISQGGAFDFFPYIHAGAREVEMEEQSDYGLRCIIMREAPIQIELSRQLQLAAAREWLRRYPRPDPYRKRWAQVIDATVQQWLRDGHLDD